MTPSHDDFYVGYRPEAPAALTGWLRPRIIVLLLATLAVAGTLMVAQRPFSAAVFEFGNERSFEGVLRRMPYPVLEVERPVAAADSPDAARGDDALSTVSRYLLVAFGKHGLGELPPELEGRRVKLRGTLIYRDERTMIEVLDGTLEAQPDAAGEAAPAREAAPAVSLGEHTLRGEIVDSKCFLGVMKPGNLKPHRACATRCISGGVPPVLLVRDPAGLATYLLLTGADGSAVNDRILDHIAEPLEITGQVERHGDLLVLRADPASYRRIE